MGRTPWPGRGALLSGLAGLVLSSCGSPGKEGRTFLLLTIDTLRADHLGTYGYPRPTSPWLDRFAAQAVLFTDFVSVSSWTMPAMGTLATGLRPNDHGMVYWHLPLKDVPETLAEVLGGAGVRTAFFGNPIPRLPGLDRGFDTWKVFEGDDRAAVDAALAWLAGTDGDRFLWVHLLSPHAPYDPRPGTARPDPSLAEPTILYDGEIRTADLLAGRLLRGIGEDAAVVVTSDHGETMDDRERLQYGHGYFLYEELLRIPWMARIPGVRPAIRTETAMLSDIPVTIAGWFGVRPPKRSYGSSLLPVLRGRKSRDPVETFAFVVEDDPPRFTDRRWAVRGGGWKAVFNIDRGTARLYDLRNDPGEREDRAGELAEQVERRREALERWREASPTPAIPFRKPFTPEELERLRAIGYLGGTRP